MKQPPPNYRVRHLFLTTIAGGGVLGVYVDPQVSAQAIAWAAAERNAAIQASAMALKWQDKPRNDNPQPWRDHRGRRRDIHHRKA